MKQMKSRKTETGLDAGLIIAWVIFFAVVLLS